MKKLQSIKRTSFQYLLRPGELSPDLCYNTGSIGSVCFQLLHHRGYVHPQENITATFYVSVGLASMHLPQLRCNTLRVPDTLSTMHEAGTLPLSLQAGPAQR
jgi:hypothetical protein